MNVIYNSLVADKNALYASQVVDMSISVFRVETGIQYAWFAVSKTYATHYIAQIRSPCYYSLISSSAIMYKLCGLADGPGRSKVTLYTGMYIHVGACPAEDSTHVHVYNNYIIIYIHRDQSQPGVHFSGWLEEPSLRAHSPSLDVP